MLTAFAILEEQNVQIMQRIKKKIMTGTEIMVQVYSLEGWMIAIGLWHFLVSSDAIKWLNTLSQDKLLSLLYQYEYTGKENPFCNPLSL